MSTLAACLRLLRILPYQLARGASRAIVFSYLLVSPRVRQEIGRNHTRRSGLSDPGFRTKQAARPGNNIALMAKVGPPVLEKQLDIALIDGQNILE